MLEWVKNDVRGGACSTNGETNNFM